jgi:CMP/dCMP kinase
MSIDSKEAIAIDGYSGCGKSTLAKDLATRLSWVYVDSGAMYRAVTLYFIQQNLSGVDVFENKHHLTNHIRISFEDNSIFLNGINVGKEIRTMEVASLVSSVSAIPEVRTSMVEMQRAIGAEHCVVMDGRDIGTVVFPNACLKLFLTADFSERVRRRMIQDNQSNEREIRRNLFLRDYYDTSRTHSPLTKANDAVVIDNTHLKKEEQLELTLTLLRLRKPNLEI